MLEIKKKESNHLFENIDKTKSNFLVKNVYNKSNKMSNWSKISSSNSVDDTMEHKKE